MIQELDGEPAFAVLERLHRAADPADRELMAGALFLGVAMREDGQVYQRGDFLVRNLLGADPSSGAIAVAASLAPLQVVQFHVRDADAARDDLGALLAARTAPCPAGALLFSCTGRGEQLFGTSGHDSGCFHDQVGAVPLGGFFCNGEIGPVHGTSYLHAYTSAFGLFRSS
jgi:small ligand-binding sensory domain FIST